MNILSYIAFSLRRHSNKEKNQENLINGTMQALKITFPPLPNGVFGFYTDMCATKMLQTVIHFINKNSYLLLKIIRVVVNNIRQVKTFARIMMANNL